MSKTLDSQLSFSGGEWSPLLDARVDHPSYTKACRQLQNMIALKQGGVTRRPGMLHIAPAKYSDPNLNVRLVEFQFSPTTAFILEFGHLYVRFYSNKQRVVLSSAPGWVSGTTYQPGAFVQDPTAANAIYYCISGNPFVSVVAPHLAPLSWVLQSIYEVPSPYTADTGYGSDVIGITPCQINDVVYLSHPSYPPYKLTRFSDTNWKLEQVVFLSPPLLDPNVTGVTIAASALTGAITLTADAPAWVAATYYAIGRSVSSGGVLYTCIVAHLSGATFPPDLVLMYWRVETIFQNAQIGGMFQLSQVRNSTYIEKALTANGSSATLETSGKLVFDTYGTWSADVAMERSDDQGVTWQKIRTITSRSDHNGSIEVDAGPDIALFRLTVSNYVSSTGTPRATLTAPSAVVFGLVRITNVAGAYSASADVVSQLKGTAATLLWAEGAWSALRGYPRAVTAFQQRLVFGGSDFEPQRIWGSVQNDLENFALGDQSLDTDSYAFDIAAVGRGPILWLVGQIDLYTGFSGAEWIINSGLASYGGAQQPITPTQINASEHSSFGSVPGVPPEVVGNSVIYPQRSAKSLQQMQFSVYTNKYMSQDVSSLSEHLFALGIVQIAYQPQFRNQGILWVVTQSGSLCAMTYEPAVEVAAWHRHITGYNPDDQSLHAIESVAAIEGDASDDDQVWVVVNRPNGRTIELVNPVNWETDAAPIRGLPQPDIASAIFVDASITVNNPATNAIPGLGHLNGLSVIALLNGNIGLLPALVTAGVATFEEYTPTAGDVLQVGLPIYYAVEPMRLDANPQAGPLLGVTKALSRLYLRLFNSLSGRVSDGTAKETPIQYRLASLPLDQGPPIFTGQKEVQPFSTLSDDPRCIVVGHDAFPLTILAQTYRLGVGGSS